MKIYELAYLLVPTMKEEDIPAKVGNLKESISNLGGTFITEDYPKPLDLAYVMERRIANKKNSFSQGHFGWFKFEMSADNSIKLKVALDLDEDIIRFMIIRTVRENTLAPRSRFSQPGRTETRKRAEEAGEPKAEMTEKEVKEIDKKIEELVA